MSNTEVLAKSSLSRIKFKGLLFFPTLPPASTPATMKEYSSARVRLYTVLLVVLSVVFVMYGCGNILAAAIVIVYVTGGQLVVLGSGEFHNNRTEVIDKADELRLTGALEASVTCSNR